MFKDIRLHFWAMVILLSSGLIMAFLLGFGILPDDPFINLASVLIISGTGAMITCIALLFLMKFKGSNPDVYIDAKTGEDVTHIVNASKTNQSRHSAN